jgi:hypothetical protein
VEPPVLWCAAVAGWVALADGVLATSTVPAWGAPVAVATARAVRRS